MPRKTPPRQDVDLEELIARIQRINPTGRGVRRSEERARYAEKARLQSLLVETHPHDVRIRIHHDMPGIVSLSIPRLQMSAGHAVVDALSSAARDWVESQCEQYEQVVPSSRSNVRSNKTNASNSFIERAERLLVEYDFECAIQTLTEGVEDPRVDNEERIRALLLLLEVHVDHLANHDAALELESALRACGGLSERAHELLGIAAARAGDVAHALHHLLKCRGERVGAELAAMARASVHARAFTHARKAWMHLNSLAATTEPPLATSLATLRDEVRVWFVQEAIDKPGEAIDADPELERFVREFAPRHPWLLARRDDAQRARFESFVRSALQKARDAKAAGDGDEISLVLETLDGAGLSPADAAEIAELRAWADDRRAVVQAMRALSLADSQDLDAACHAYVTLSPQAREHLRARGSHILLNAMDQLNAVFPDRTNARAILRAAIAWTQAHRSSDKTSAWSMLAPHAALLEAVPAFVPSLSDVRAYAERARVLADSSRAEGTPEVHDECVEGACFSEWNGPLCDVRPIRIARHALRIGGESFVLTLSQGLDDAGCIVSLWPCRSSATPRHVRIHEIEPGSRLHIVAQKQRAVLWDEKMALWIVDFAGATTVRRVGSSLCSIAERHTTLVAVDEEHCALRAGDENPEIGSWQIVHVPSGTMRAQLHGPRLHCVHSAQGATFYRVTGLCLERLDVTGHVVDHFELPKNVSPWVLVEIPGASRPIVVASAIVRSCVLAWWQPMPRFFRSFELFDARDHGELVDAWGLADQGMFVLTQRNDKRVFLHAATMEKGVLRPSRHRQVNFESCSMVHDPWGRRAWVVRSSNEMPMEIHDFIAWFERT